MDDFSIDSLVASREHERLSKPENFLPRRKPASSENQAASDLPELPENAAGEADGTIYAKCECHFPAAIFDKIEPGVKPSSLYCIEKGDFVHLLAKLHPSRVYVDDRVIYGLLQGLVESGDCVFGETLLQLYPHLRVKLSFPCLVYFLRMLLEKDESLAAYVLVLFDPAIIDSRECCDVECFLVHFGALLSSRIVGHREFFRTEDVRQRVMMCGCMELVTVLADMLAECPIQCVAGVIQHLPLLKETAPFLRDLYVETIMRVSGVKQSNVVDMIVDVCKMMKGMIETRNPHMVLRVSAELSLVEKVIAASVVMGEVTRTEVGSVVRSLRFAVSRSISEFTSICEQVQATRTQIGLIADEVSLLRR